MRSTYMYNQRRQGPNISLVTILILRRAPFLLPCGSMDVWPFRESTKKNVASQKGGRAAGSKAKTFNNKVYTWPPTPRSSPDLGCPQWLHRSLHQTSVPLSQLHTLSALPPRPPTAASIFIIRRQGVHRRKRNLLLSTGEKSIEQGTNCINCSSHKEDVSPLLLRLQSVQIYFNHHLAPVCIYLYKTQKETKLRYCKLWSTSWKWWSTINLPCPWSESQSVLDSLFRAAFQPSSCYGIRKPGSYYCQDRWRRWKWV